ncbi:MAG TPA: tetratricopeptide repeat protein [Bryobacteraceae bacterium]|nr:tetratricopeptide repeat protein [Bryobacteraceae bacterium]
MTRATNGQFAAAETMAIGAYVSDTDHALGSCVGIILSDVALLMSASGELAGAEKLAEQSVAILEPLYPAHDPILLGPLQVLAGARFAQGKIASAKQAFKGIQLTRIQRPEDSAAVHAWAGWFLYIAGRWAEAEHEYLSALQALSIAGYSNSADAGSVLNALGSLYIEEHRLDEAERVLDHAAAVFGRAEGVPADRIKLLNAWGVLHARQGKWREAERELHESLSLADSTGWTDLAAQRSLLRNYSQVLRRNNNKHEAQAIEKRLSALQAARTKVPVVDISELLPKTKADRCGNCEK